MRTRPCTVTIRRGRLRKAEQFLAAAEMIRELASEHAAIADADVSLCVHAGIAASDVICCARLGEHAQGESHIEAVGLLRTADNEAAKHLSALLNLKAKSNYSHTPVTADEFKRASRAAEALVQTARRMHASVGT